MMRKIHCRWLSNDPWLTEALGKPSYRLTLDDVNDFDDWYPPAKNLELGNCLIYAKVPTDSIRSIHWLEGQDFRLVDTGITLQREVLNQGQRLLTTKGFCVRFAMPADKAGVIAIARRVFSQSRFHLDPKISNSTANKIKADWAGNFFKGKRGDHMIVVECERNIVGFLQLLHQGDALVIDLIATDDSVRGQGIGRAMVAYAEESISDVAQVVLGTQLANQGALNFYHSLDFRMQQSVHVFHRHITE